MDRATALNLIDLHTTGGISTHNTARLFANVAGMTIAAISYVTEVATSAKSPHRGQIIKVTRANVMLANNLKEYTNVYLNKIKRTAGEPVTDWQPTETYFQHTDTFCITQHKQHADRFYLYAFFNGADSVYINTATNLVMSKDDVAAELTPSAAKKLLEDKSEVYNKTNDVTHNAIVRTISLENVVSISIKGQTYSGSFFHK